MPAERRRRAAVKVPAPPPPPPPADPEVAAAVRRLKHRDPAVFARDLAAYHAALAGERAGRRPARGLDLGTRCGYALCWYVPGVPFDPRAAYTVMGQLALSAGSYDSGGIRLLRLRHFLGVINPRLILYEDVRYTP